MNAQTPNGGPIRFNRPSRAVLFRVIGMYPTPQDHPQKIHAGIVRRDQNR